MKIMVILVGLTLGACASQPDEPLRPFQPGDKTETESGWLSDAGRLADIAINVGVGFLTRGY